VRSTPKTRQLYLLRHAKSSWDDAGVPDHDRPLAPRGERSMKAMARHLRHAGVHPQLVLCSSALRARQTLQRVLPALGDGVRLEVEEELYTFDAVVLLRRLKRVPAAISSLLLVGHNPAMQDLTLRLAGSGSGDALERAGAKFPTGALASIDVPSAWSRLRAGDARLASFVTPRDLS
jgi:phosphohistidine phosphatase